MYLGDRDVPLLKDIIYIDPNWLTQQVYCLINNKLRDKNGEITQEYLKEAFPEDSETQRKQLLELLVNFELIFEDKEEKGLFISPQYLPEDPNRYARRIIDAFLSEWTSGFTFRFPRFVPENVMINFLSRYGPYSNKVYWKRGIFFQSSTGVNCLVTYKDQSLTVQTTTHPQASSMQREICAAFVELSRKANAEVSLDGEVFVSWQELEKQHKIGSLRIEATDGSSHLMAEYIHLLPKKASGAEEDMERYSLSKEPTAIRWGGLTELIINGKIDRTFEILHQELDDSKINDLTLLQARWSKNEREKSLLDKRDYDLEYRRILTQLIEWARKMDIRVALMEDELGTIGPTNPPPEEKTYYDRLIELLKNNKAVAIAILIFMVAGAVVTLITQVAPFFSSSEERFILSGQVVSANNPQQGLAGARVLLQGSQSLTAYSKKDGVFFLPLSAKKGDIINLEIDLEGFQRLNEPVTILDTDDTLFLAKTFDLTPIQAEPRLPSLRDSTTVDP